MKKTIWQKYNETIVPLLLSSFFGYGYYFFAFKMDMPVLLAVWISILGGSAATTWIMATKYNLIPKK